MELAAFLHVWAEGEWRTPVSDFLRALGETEFDGPLFIGLVGRPSKQIAVEDYIAACGWADRAMLVASATEGFESITIEAVRRYAWRNSGAVVYAHSKGSASVEPFRDRWRRSMLNRVVRPWRDNLELLENHDAVGCHWLTAEEYPEMLGNMTQPAPGSGFFGGNFWMARCDYVRKLTQCPSEPRWQAEAWIGWGYPRVFDLLPGWPQDQCWPELCA